MLWERQIFNAFPLFAKKKTIYLQLVKNTKKIM